MDVVDRIYFIMTMYLTLTFGKFLYYIHLKKGFSNCDSKQSLIIINDIDLTFDFLSYRCRELPLFKAEPFSTVFTFVLVALLIKNCLVNINANFIVYSLLLLGRKQYLRFSLFILR